MSKQTSLLAAAAVIAGIVSVSLWLQLRAERETSRLLRERVAQFEIAQSVASVELVTQVGPTVQSQARVAESQADETKAPAPMIAPAIPARPNPLKLPESREALRLALRAGVARSYPGLGRALQLTQQETDALFDLLAKQQFDSSVSVIDRAVLGDISRTDPVADMQLAQRAAAQDAEINAFLGNRYAQWQNYGNTRGFRQKVGQWDETLAASSLGFSDEQTDALIAALAAENSRSPSDTSIPDMRTSADMGASRSAESNRRVLDAAASALNPQQLRALERLIDAQMAATLARDRASRAELEALRQAGGN